MKPSEILNSLIKDKRIEHDVLQEELAIFLDGISYKIDKRSKSWFKNSYIKGIYLYGKVGRGKTQLMDIFYNSLKTKKKKRLHFHRFMQELHDDLNKFSKEDDPINTIVENLSKECEVLCFDEFLVEDIGDAMILGRFLDKLFTKRIVLFATSNTKPSNLYKDGLHRDRFLPAISLIEENCHPYKLDINKDYRLRSLEKRDIYIDAGLKETDDLLRSLFKSLAQGKIEKDTSITILGREVFVRMISQGTAWFSFQNICNGARSAKDYIELSKEFHTIIVSNIPKFKNKDDQARRFIALIDECYERNVNIILSLDSDLNNLYEGERLKDPFKRTISRLQEMRSRDYLAKPHLP